MTNRSDRGQPVGYGRSLVELLLTLRTRAGNPSYREIARRIPSSTGQHTSPGYVSEVLRGARVPSGDMAAVAEVRAFGRQAAASPEPPGTTGGIGVSWPDSFTEAVEEAARSRQPGVDIRAKHGHAQPWR